MASVLVVDDEPDIRYLTQLQLELDGHRVMTAADGVEALTAMRAEVPDGAVSAAANELGVSRSNIYASLRRIIRRTGHDSVPELLRRLRAGQVVVDD